MRIEKKDVEQKHKKKPVPNPEPDDPAPDSEPLPGDTGWDTTSGGPRKFE
jgi:hypothetical protein